MPDSLADFPKWNAVLGSEVSHPLMKQSNGSIGGRSIMIEAKYDSLGTNDLLATHGFKVVEGHGRGTVRPQSVIDAADHKVAGMSVAARFGREDFFADGFRDHEDAHLA